MNKHNLSLPEQIEYYLGKDRLPNLHWKPTIPEAWSIPPRNTGMALCNPDAHNTTIVLGEGIEYCLNNLGYRAKFDYTLNELKTKNIILVLGDSDTFARGVEFDNIYTSILQKNTELTVLNLGVNGLSPDGMTRIGAQSILALGSAVKHVCVLWPVFSLREFVSKNFKCGIHNMSDYIPYADWWDHIDWVSNNYNYQKNKILLEQTSLNAGAEYHDLIINRYDKNAPTTYSQVAGGTFTELDANSHLAIANYFARKINNRSSLYAELNTQL